MLLDTLASVPDRSARMAMPPSRFWQDLTHEDFTRLDPERTVVLLPVAAIEQHGPHLPVSVDATLNAGVLAAALDRLPASLPLLVLPAMPVGKSDEHIAFPGTLTLSAETLIRLWTEIGDSVARAGLRKLVLFNAHGGQPQVMDIVARELRVRLGMMAVAANWYSFGTPEGLFPAEELRHGIHGGSVETSMMLHLRPDLVRREHLRNFRSLGQDMAGDYRLLGPTLATGKLAWQTEDLNPEGACGDATDADAGRGAKLVDHAARQFVALLQEVRRFPLDRLRTGFSVPKQG